MNAKYLKAVRKSFLAWVTVASCVISPLAGAYTLDIQAYIDGRDVLILQGNTAQWEHFDFAAVGRWDNQNLPTYLDRVAWTPDWPGNSGEIRTYALSSTFSGLASSLPSGPMTVTLQNLTVGRGPVTFEQSPGILRVQFNDNDIGQPVTTYADWYHVQLTVTPVPEPETYAMLLAGLGLMGAVARRRKLAA